MSYANHKDLLLSLAWESIEHGYNYRRPVPADLSNLPEALLLPTATFVTLQKREQLRGCIGTLEAHRPLVEDIAHNAFAAAFKDPRFEPLQKDEHKLVNIHISILSQPQTMTFNSEQDLLDQIQPLIDGLIIEVAGKRGTFLPSVWEALPDKMSFLNHLKAKAGLAQNYWSEEIKVWRYTSESLK